MEQNVVPARVPGGLLHEQNGRSARSFIKAIHILKDKAMAIIVCMIFAF
jgi:hypothetical protein